ncbi:hypothetical protein CTEN210_13643 [Chaetoceros tenuissimus]|uniref:Leucine-rich repeat domain-containing protein n=1 Tax=Chaetoceros tenuissimus TaxID=426638 RepID=A0AAD3HAY4_9STRA|nr:hypothetical protein CTEN210_13643 [Chaetoceros tenuissimus]
MRVQTEEWRRFIPGVRMYKGKKTLFYNGEILFDDETGEWLIYDKEERKSWKVIFVLPGVEIIGELTFAECCNVETVIMADSVKRIKDDAFANCRKLAYVKLSTILEYIGKVAFYRCSLTSVFIPQSCREIESQAFYGCRKLVIFHVPQETQLYGWDVISGTALIAAAPFEMNEEREDEKDMDNEMNDWIKNINNEEKYTLHRLCCSHIIEMNDIQTFVEREGLRAMTVKNTIGVTPSEYLEANPFLKVEEKQIIKDFILRKMGEMV